MRCAYEGEKVLVANRGEIAVRIIRTCKEMGIPVVAVYSTIDANALHVSLADEAVCIGEAPSKDSYLNIPNIVAAAMSHNCTMLHPGYGFLAENATFADICLDHGLNFIGPKVSAPRGHARERVRCGQSGTRGLACCMMPCLAVSLQCCSTPQAA